MVTLYLGSRAALRRRACSLPAQFTMKLFTTRLKVMGDILCLHSPGVISLDVIHMVPGFGLGNYVKFGLTMVVCT